MPIIQDSMPTIFPKPGTVMCRYMDVTKFLSLLSTNTLFFCRIDKLEDHFEGRTAKGNFHIRYVANKYLNFNNETPTEEEVLARVQELYDFDEKVREVTCVCCWNKFVHESAALWKIYSDFGKGIMIKSTIERVLRAFEKTIEPVRVSEVQYTNYRTGSIPDFNTAFPITHKQDAYNYEQEVRLIYEIDGPQIGKTFDWANQPIQEGKSLRVDVNLLIEEIIVAPFAPNWFKSLIEDVCSRYSIKVPISKSILSMR